MCLQMGDWWGKMVIKWEIVVEMENLEMGDLHTCKSCQNQQILTKVKP